MRMPEIIRKKRDGGELSKPEIDCVIEGCVRGSVPDYQLSALLMAIYYKGMTPAETTAFTLAMRDSGELADLSGIEGIKVDKHSTGGVGDKTTLIVAPIVASCGVKVAKMSGRGLGHTGGTIDKLESIPGFRTDLPPAEFKDIVNRCGLSVIGQSGNLCPADKKLYALRDVTATVDSIPLIAASIMSKKLAAGSDCIVLDVKVGSGSFMKSMDEAEELARTMVNIGAGAGKRTLALLTGMDEPLGRNVGNALEVQEAVGVLRGEGAEDLAEVCRELAANMLFLAGKGDMEHCRELVYKSVESGAALERLRAMVASQGGDAAYIDDPSLFGEDRFKRAVRAPADGYISHMHSERIGLAAVCLGAGRSRKDDGIDPLAGIVIKSKVGDKVKAGDEIALLYAADEKLFAEAEEKYLSALTLSAEKSEKKPLIFGRIEK